MTLSHIAFVFGSRQVTDYEMVDRALTYLLLTPPPATDYELRHHLRPSDGITRVWSGGARGADTLAASWCRRNGVAVREFLPDWRRLGRRAGFVRTRTIVAALPANSLCVCFAPPGAQAFSEITPGSAYAVRECRRRHHQVVIVWPDGCIRYLGPAPGFATQRETDTPAKCKKWAPK